MPSELTCFLLFVFYNKMNPFPHTHNFLKSKLKNKKILKILIFKCHSENKREEIYSKYVSAVENKTTKIVYEKKIILLLVCS